ncbi:MAG: TolC family protein [Acidiferrobacterales bacterium]|nr:TolC family protein [Acidiferrobacterales bacterium]
MTIKTKKISSILVAVLLISSCATTELPELPSTDIPQQWTNGGNDQVNWPNLDWWQNFESAELSQIMSRLQLENLDLANNARNLEQAQLTLRDAGFDLYPAPILDIGVSERYTGIKPDGESYTDSSSGSASLDLGLSYTNILSKPARYDAALARYDGDVASLADMRLNTLGTAASTYFQILLIRDRITAAEQNLENAEAIARIIQARADAGTVTSIDALQQRIAVERQRNNLKNLKQNELSARASMSNLLASSVNDLRITASTLADISVPAVQPGIPSDLLLRRPDLVAAESDLRLFRANVDLARLEFLPNISLTAAAGIASGSLSGLFDDADINTSGLGNIVLTLLDNGARKRALRSSRLDLESSLANYRGTVISAFNEIEVSLGSIELLNSLASVAADDLARAEEAFRIAGVRYREGIADYQTVLTTQDTLFSVRNSFLDSKLNQLNAIISLYQSLGGGWIADSIETHN